MNNDLLFVYGSLLNGDNEFGQYLKQNTKLVNSGFFKGILYDCGEYPGAIEQTYGYKIKGALYRLNNPLTAFALLDDYEGFGEDQKQPNLFVRKLISVECDNENINCWIYLYNLPVAGLTEITSGDYMAYTKAKKKSLRGFTGRDWII